MLRHIRNSCYAAYDLIKRGKYMLFVLREFIPNAMEHENTGTKGSEQNEMKYKVRLKRPHRFLDPVRFWIVAKSHRTGAAAIGNLSISAPLWICPCIYLKLKDGKWKMLTSSHNLVWSDLYIAWSWVTVMKSGTSAFGSKVESVGHILHFCAYNGVERKWHLRKYTPNNECRS